MKTDVEKLDPTRVRLSVEVPFAELRSHLEKAYRTINGQIRVPGFRPGKAPQRVIDSRVGRGTVLEQAINDALPGLYGRAVEQSGVMVVGQPDVEITQIDDGDRLTFTADVDVKPEFDLPSRDGLAVTVPVLEVKEEDVDAELEALRERFAAQVPVERPAAEGDLVTIDLTARHDGEVVDGGQATGQTYRIGSGTMVEGLDEAVTGMSAGETTTFATTLVGPSEGLAADVEVSVTAVRALELPELDDEFAQLASEFDTVDELREDMRTRVRRARQGEQLIAARDGVLDAYLAQVDIPVPDRLLEHELEHRRDAIASELAMVGLTREQYLTSRELTEDELEAETRAAAEKAIRSQFVLERLATEEKLSVEQDELTHQLMTNARRSGMSADQYVQQVMQSGSVSSVVGEVVRAKALQLLVRGATVTDQAGTKIDINDLEVELADPEDVIEVEEEVEGDEPAAAPTEPEVDDAVAINVPIIPDAGP